MRAEVRIVIFGRKESDRVLCDSISELPPYVQIVGVTNNRKELVHHIVNDQVSVCVMGSDMLDERDEVTEIFEKRGVTSPKWVIITFHLTGSLCLQAAHKGIDDLIDLRDGRDGIVERLLLVSNGYAEEGNGYPIPSRWVRKIPFVRHTILDQFDADIMRSLLCGKSNSDIAADVHLSTQTVNNRISNMIHRSSTSSRTQLALLFAEAHPFHLSSKRHQLNLSNSDR